MQNTYTITLPTEQVGYTLTMEGGVDAVSGSEFTLTFAMDIEYSASAANLVIMLGDEDITSLFERDPMNRMPSAPLMYTGTVSGNAAVTVSGLTQNVYTVQLPAEQVGYTIESDVESGVAGEQYTLTLTLDEMYSDSDVALSISYGEVEFTEVEGNVYTYVGTFGYMDGNPIVAVSGLVQNTYTITLPTEQVGYTLTMEGGVDAVSGSEFTLTFAMDIEYSASAANLVIMLGDEDITSLFERDPMNRMPSAPLMYADLCRTPTRSPFPPSR